MPAKNKTKPKPNSLIEDARKSASQYRKKAGQETWFTKLESHEPNMCEELKTLCLDWHKGGETRDLFPSKADLHRFVSDKVIKVSRYAFDSWMNELTSS